MKSGQQHINSRYRFNNWIHKSWEGGYYIGVAEEVESSPNDTQVYARKNIKMGTVAEVMDVALLAIKKALEDSNK